MMARTRVLEVGGVMPLLGFVCLMALASCSGEMVTPKDETPAGAGQGRIDPQGDSEFLLGGVEIVGAATGRVEVFGMNLLWDPAGKIVSVDIVLSNQTDVAISAPLHFLIISLNPSSVGFQNPDGHNDLGIPFSDFSGQLGDGVLSPGETSGAVGFEFHNPEGVAFAIVFGLNYGVGPLGVISGTVFRDDDGDGGLDPGEPGVPGINVRIPTTPGGGPELVATTDASGRYVFNGLNAGLHAVWVVPDPRWIAASPNPLLVTLLENSDGTVQRFPGADFGLAPADSAIDGVTVTIEGQATNHPLESWVIHRTGMASVAVENQRLHMSAGSAYGVTQVAKRFALPNPGRSITMEIVDFTHTGTGHAEIRITLFNGATKVAQYYRHLGQDIGPYHPEEQTELDYYSIDTTPNGSYPVSFDFEAHRPVGVTTADLNTVNIFEISVQADTWVSGQTVDFRIGNFSISTGQ